MRIFFRPYLRKLEQSYRLQRENKRLQARVEKLQEECWARTFALQQAIGMAQEGIEPSLSTYNKWRVTLGWKKLPDEFRIEVSL